MRQVNSPILTQMLSKRWCFFHVVLHSDWSRQAKSNTSPACTLLGNRTPHPLILKTRCFIQCFDGSFLSFHVLINECGKWTPAYLSHSPLSPPEALKGRRPVIELPSSLIVSWVRAITGYLYWPFSCGFSDREKPPVEIARQVTAIIQLNLSSWPFPFFLLEASEAIIWPLYCLFFVDKR